MFWYKKAAEAGQVNAQNNLGFLYQNGIGVPQDFAKAVELYQKAARQGNAAAQNNLGMMYEQGTGVPEDLVLAYAWLNLAAAQNENGAAETRDGLKLTGDQIKEAQRLSSNWSKGDILRREQKKGTPRR